jgi:hypothetical protein
MSFAVIDLRTIPVSSGDYHRFVGPPRKANLKKCGPARFHWTVTAFYQDLMISSGLPVTRAKPVKDRALQARGFTPRWVR